MLPTNLISFATNAFSGCTDLQNPSIYGTVYTSSGTNIVTNYFTVPNGFYVNFVSYP
jgi:hypothetical protein